jgi:AhpD family alkylhydroperoxidase
MPEFTRRTYKAGQFAGEIAGIIRDGKDAAGVLGGRVISPAFRERLMLEVTGENKCRYCTAAHSRLGRKAGLSDSEISSCLAGSVDQAPEEERAALRYARHWAETEARPDPIERKKLDDAYGPDKARLIEMALRLIRVGNLSGNTLDSILFKLSGGRAGGAV